MAKSNKTEFVPSEHLLEVNDLQVNYGVIRALKGISFYVDRGEIVSLIGANGAGKTTTLHTITGLLRPVGGQMIYANQDLSKVPAHKVVSMGLVHVPEGRRIFQSLSVYENLRMGAYSQKDKSRIEENMKLVFSLFPRLEERKKQMAGTLSGGEQQMLAMGRALLSDPEMVVLDEPSMGLSPLLVSEVFDIIKTFRENGKTVLLVEQNAKKAMSISDRVYVLETGSIIKEGKASDLINDESIKKAYLGE
ncbi:MAG: ABC transporter ATP-binding protein [Clostridia bacterium]|nr:ABC transporter ATP-binding protein [Clostridia bacterium]